MPGIILEEAEKVYIIHGVQDDIRGDGRSRMDYRSIEFETDIVESCNGSCLLKLADTKLLAVVKAELTKPLASAPDRGRIEVSIENTPHAHVDFDGRGGEDFASDISKLLTVICNDQKFLDLKPLCLLEGKQVWFLYVDIMVLGYGGNYIDAASLATKLALYYSKIRKTVTKSESEEAVPEIEVSEDPYDVFSLNVENLPILMTMYRIGGEFIVDATGEEEACSISKLVLAVSPKEVVTMKQIGGSGSIHVASISDAIEIGQEMGIAIQEKLAKALKIEKVSKNK